MKAEYCMCRDKILFKRFINVRQIFKEAPAVFFMGDTCEEVLRRRNKAGKETALLFQKRLSGETQKTRRKRKEREGECNEGLEDERKRAEPLLTRGNECEVRTAGEGARGVCVCVRARTQLVGHHWSLSGQMEV